MHDIVRYRLPLGPLGSFSHALIVKRDLNAIFDYRFQRIAERFGSVKWPTPLASTSEGPIHVSGQNV